MEFVLPESGINLQAFKREAEIAFIKQAMERTNNIRTYAARLLGIKRTALVMKLRAYGLNDLRPTK